MDDKNRKIPIAECVRCKDCGAEHKDYPWTPGTLCPDCNSLYFEPVVVVTTESDYAKADRSKGFAQEDLRFGRLAQWAEMISPRQFQRLLFQQSNLIRQGNTAPDLARICLKEKILNRRQVEALHVARCVEPGNTDDLEFGIAATQMQFLTETQLRECQKLQREAFDQGRDVPPLPLLACEKRFMKEGQVLALLKNSERRGKGLLHRINRAATKRREADFKEQTRGRGSLAHNPVVRASVTVIVLMVAVMAWYIAFFGGNERYAITRCVNCGAEGGAPADSKWPLECEVCKQKEVYHLAICEKCAHRFPLKGGMGYGVSCPKCKNDRFKVIISGEVDAAKIKEEVQDKRDLFKNLEME